MIINKKELLKDHPSISSHWFFQLSKTTRKKNPRAFAKAKARLLQLIQEIRELHADVPPPTGTLEEN